MSFELSELTVRIYYEDTDFSGRVYHASYLRFLERGRTEWLRALGIEQGVLAGVAAGGFGFVVRRMAIDFLKPARIQLFAYDSPTSWVRNFRSPIPP